MGFASIFQKFLMTAEKIIVLGTGGTIAGTAASSADHTGYTAAQLSVADLLRDVPGMREALRGDALHSEQLAQLDSKDMDFTTMTRLFKSCAHHLAQSDVRGVVITHGTDTLEETAYFLHLVLGAACAELIAQKPVVLTCAMRPATSSEADGPRNLRDAVMVARDALRSGGQARGVLAVCAGDVHHAVHVQKIHTYALNAFSSGDAALGEAGVLARAEQGSVLWNAYAELIFKQNEPIVSMEYARNAHDLIASNSPEKIHWPRVEIVMNHANQDGSIVRALIATSTPTDPIKGIVVAGTGNSTVSDSLEKALQDARQAGVEVIIASRCVWSEQTGLEGALLRLSPVKQRMAMSLRSIEH
jgi:L-asparaginase